MPNFETFKRTEFRQQDSTPRVTITTRGTFNLNRATYAALGEPAAVEFLYDADAQVIGLRGVPKDQVNGYAVRAAGNNYTVGGRAFTSHYRLDLTTGRRRAATLVDGILCIDLTDPGDAVTSNRAKHG